MYVFVTGSAGAPWPEGWAGLLAKLPALDLPAEVGGWVGLACCGWAGLACGRWQRSGRARRLQAAAASGRPCGCSLAQRDPLMCGAGRCLKSPPRPAPRPRHPGDALSQILGPAQAARRSDMDMNGHVNNVAYAAWALEAVPRPVYDACHLYQARWRSGRVLSGPVAGSWGGAAPRPRATRRHRAPCTWAPWRPRAPALPSLPRLPPNSWRSTSRRRARGATSWSAWHSAAVRRGGGGRPADPRRASARRGRGRRRCCG